ncbi:SaV-like [uncultured Caudovirales phage]|uniref:SaV-like n=1 Tax=uncultured Caudovirales phage TaxID=2100421 RepID=A0A6J5R1Q3_9CAUD|nr:SaV-like [uncultured Caudovirales phage]
MSDPVNHPAHYGTGQDDPTEHQKVVRAWNLGYHLGNATKYICRAGKKPGADTIQDLEKAVFYIQKEIEFLRDQRAAAATMRFEKNRELDPRD